MVLELSSIDNWKSHWFIDACRTKNTEKVRQLLPLMNYEEINATDDDGHTGLHIACIQDNYDLVFLLLHSDLGKTSCSRTILNKQNMYAYEYVGSGKVRSLFILSEFANNAVVEVNQRSGSVQIRRICQTASDEQELPVPNDWLNGHTNPENTVNAQAFLSFSRLSWFARKKFRFRKERQVCEVMRSIIRRCTDDDQIYDELMRFFNLFIRTRRAEHLLRLFTVSEDFCHILRKENQAFTTLLYLYLKTFAHRAFGPGTTYRGMTASDPVQYRKMINDYRWAMQNDEYVLETCEFQSTSIDISIAHFYIAAFQQSNQPQFDILFHYNFLEKCSTALDIENISQYPDEKEVLVLPFTLFKVINIEILSSSYYIISLTNVSVPNTLQRNVREKLKNIKNCSY